MTAATGDDCIQIVDKTGKFNTALRDFMNEKGLSLRARKYGVVSIIGGQGSGKSTLLNHLFETKFDTMTPEKGRLQTTQGIWCGKAKNADVVVLDVEGTDGREAWEDTKSFENKSALLSLALTDVLIVNQWEKEVGRFNAANLPLLKTVFEVHLRLFAKGSATEKPLLLFIIRDCDGRTPPQKLHETIEENMHRIWAEIVKPPGYEGTKVTDSFELRSVPLPHYVYQTAEWQQAASDLRDTFVNSSNPSYVFLNRSEKEVPADGFGQYAEQLWATIELEGDLDLPCQRKMLAQFRCRAKAATALKELRENNIDLIKSAQERQTDLSVDALSLICADFGIKAESAVQQAIDLYNEETFGYDHEVREEELVALKQQLWQILYPPFENWVATALDIFRSQFASSSSSFAKSATDDEALTWPNFIAKLTSESLDKFKNILASLLPPSAAASSGGNEWNVAVSIKQLEDEMAKISKISREHLVSNVVNRSLSTLRRRLGSGLAVILDLSDAKMWDNIEELRRVEVEREEKRNETVVKALEISPASLNLKEMATSVIHEKVQERARERAVPDAMFRRFDELFNKGKTRQWGSWEDVDKEYDRAVTQALKIVDLFAKSRFSEEVFLNEEEISEMKDELERRARSEIEWAQTRKAEAASRGMWSMAPWIACAVLGLDNFLWLLSNPLYFILFLMLAGAGIAYYMQTKLGNYSAVGKLVADEAMKQVAALLPRPPPSPVTPSSSSTTSRSRSETEGGVRQRIPTTQRTQSD